MNTSTLASVLAGFGLAALTAQTASAQEVTSWTQKPAAPVRAQRLAPPAAVGASCIVGPTTLCVPLDDTHTVVDMSNGVGPCELNDDGSSVIALPLQFSFDFFGTAQTDLFINNNGNVSFGASFSNFSAYGFPVSGFPMIAPFWGDVDTRSGPGTVFFKSEANRFTVTWDHVGYYSNGTDKLNTFQLILTDGTDPLIGIGNNVCFCYDDMQWTTGSASGGSGGFGGTPATVGANKGDGVAFFQIGRFDHEGTDYDGPGGVADGVSFLDNNTICFNASTDNAPPVYTTAPGDMSLKSGDSVAFNVEVIAPELTQTTTLTVNSGNLANFVANVTGGAPGSSAIASCTFDPVGGQEGNHAITFTATDDGTPVQMTTHTINIEVTAGGMVCLGVGCPCPGPNDDPTAGCANSTGAGALLSASGSASVALDDLALHVTNVPAERFGIFIMGDAPECAVRAAGLLGVGGNTLRIGGHQRSTVSGTMDLGPGIGAGLAAGTILSGTTWTFQAWYRDYINQPCSSSNLSNGYCVSFTP
ncbi:MAG: hypothetical protein ACI8QZ_001119 [Chlamydiales bacterium]|jgi:hypothetical protein